MTTYILPKLSAAQRQRLTDDAVEFYDWNESVIVEKEMLDRALSALNATATELATGYQDMVELSLRFRRRPGQKAAAEQHRRTAADETSRNNYIQAASVRIQDMMTEATRTVVSSKAQLPELEKKYLDIARHRNFNNVLVTEAVMRLQFQEELQRLREVPKVRYVRVIDGTILVYTDKLCATVRDTKECFEIGHFMVAINTSGRASGVRWFNISRHINSVRARMNAPYVFEDGNAMVDEIKEPLLDLIARCEFAVVAELAIQFVETVNDDEPGRQVHKWPLARK